MKMRRSDAFSSMDVLCNTASAAGTGAAVRLLHAHSHREEQFTGEYESGYAQIEKFELERMMEYDVCYAKLKTRFLSGNGFSGELVGGGWQCIWWLSHH